MLFAVKLCYNVGRSTHRKGNIMTEKEHLSDTVLAFHAMADSYLSVNFIDLDHNTLLDYNRTGESQDTCWSNLRPKANRLMRESMSHITTEEYLDIVLDFVDLSTVRERMRNKKRISEEFVSRYSGWLRGTFVAVTTDEEKMPTSVIFTTLRINEEKKREEELLLRSNTDKLTHFYNRQAYEDDIAILDKGGVQNDFTFISLDVNCLKQINDSLGHTAGDELLKGAAFCIQKVFGSYGRLYRIGGDEFVAMIHLNPRFYELLVQDFREEVDRWKGEQVDSLAVSYGAARACDYPDKAIKELIKIADKHMYDDKALFYQSKGIDRRGQMAAFDALCRSYIKILRVDLTEDTYSIIQMDEAEKTSANGFCDSFYKWIHDFATTGHVHEENMEQYLEYVAPDFIKNYFNAKNPVYCLYYKRKMNGEYKRVMLEMIPTAEYTEEHQTVFLYIKNLDPI